MLEIKLGTREYKNLNYKKFIISKNFSREEISQWFSWAILKETKDQYEIEPIKENLCNRQILLQKQIFDFCSLCPKRYHCLVKKGNNYYQKLFKNEIKEFIKYIQEQGYKEYWEESPPNYYEDIFNLNFF